MYPKMELQDLIEGELRVGAFHEEDIPAFVAAARESVDVMAPWMPWCHPAYSEAEAREWIELCAARLRDDIAYDLGIYSLDRRQLYGCIAINQINRQHNVGNIGYWVRASQQRRGIATRAVHMIARFGFDTLKLTRLEILAVEGNQASRGVAIKAGAIFESMARNRLMLRGVPHTAAVYGLVPERAAVL